MAHRHTPVQAENVASLGTAHSHTTNTILETLPEASISSISSIRYNTISLLLTSSISSSQLSLSCSFHCSLFPFLLDTRTRLHSPTVWPWIVNWPTYFDSAWNDFFEKQRPSSHARSFQSKKWRTSYSTQSQTIKLALTELREPFSRWKKMCFSKKANGAQPIYTQIAIFTEKVCFLDNTLIIHGTITGHFLSVQVG